MIQPASLLYSLFLGGLSLGLFFLVASRGKAFGLMRVYLWLSMALMATPFLWPLLGSGVQAAREVLPQVQVLSNLKSMDAPMVSGYSWISVAYTAGFVVFLTLFLRSLWAGFRLFQGATWDETNRVYWVDSTINPCSFAGRIFLPRNTPVQEEVLRHERVHVVNRHFEEQVLSQLFSMVFWWNPFAHLLAQQQKLVHEWEADAVASGQEQKSYAETMIRYAAQPSLGISFSSHKQQLKQRIMKLQDPHNTARTKWSLAIIPLLALGSLWLSPAVQAQTAERTQASDVDAYPLPPGCEGASAEESKNCFFAYVQNHLIQEIHYPKEAQTNKVQGKSFVQFVVGANGKISDAKILRSSAAGNSEGELQPSYAALDQEALRVVQSMAAMKPAEKNGKPVSLEMVLPITFQLN